MQHVNFLDPYQKGRSLIHAMDARIKLPLAILYILTTAIIPHAAWALYILLFAGLLMVEILSELGIGFYWRRALLAVPFVLAALPLLFTVPGMALVQFPWGWTISLAGVERFISVGLKSWLSVQMAIALASTTTFPEILGAMRSLRLPKLLVAIISLMWRYLFVMVDETIRLIRARDSRSAASAEARLRTGGSVLWRARVTGGMAGSLFLRSLERSDRIYMAMLARGYDGEIRALPRSAPKRADWIILTVGTLLLLFIIILAWVI